MAAPRPLPPTPPGLLDDEDPGKWDRVKQALWETNINAPVRGIYNMMNADPYTLYTDTGAAGQQAVADSFDAAGGVTAGSAMIPKPSNALAMGIKTSLEGIRAKYPNVKLNVYDTPQGITLSRIEVPKGERGKGIGTSVMADLTAIADENGLPVALSPSGDFGGSVGRLKEFYSRFGFVPNKGRSKDFRISESYVRNPSQPPAPKGIKAYHASPYSFDKFSMDKVGTGVGAPDAFSKGLYFSEAEKNAEHFKRLGASPMIGGKKGRAAGLSPDAYESVWRFAHDEGKSGTLADVAAAAEADLLARSKELTFSARRDYQRVIDELNARGGEDVQLGANMYEVNINADPSTFADWDAPISQQSDAVKIALADFSPEKTWGQVYDTGKIREAEMLKRGVSGTKFKANDGTPNYVVFDDSLINIIKKYGIAGLLGAGGMYGMSDDEAQAGAR